MAFWAVKGYDAFFGGLHGMYSLDVIEGTEAEASERGLELSWETIESYADIIDQLECEVEGYDFDDEDEEDSIREEVYQEDVEFYYFELDETKLPTHDVRELSNMYYNNEDEFRAKYGKTNK
jgi:hypothetical protein